MPILSFSQDWNFIDQLAPADSTRSDFGVQTVLTEDKMVVTWPRIFTDGADADNCGEVITYEKDTDGEYQEVARLTAQDLTGSCEVGDGFGQGLAYNNGRLAIAMAAGQRKGWGFSGTSNDTDGRIFITHFENGNWVLDQTLVAEDLVDGQQGMGVGLVFENDILLTAANTYDDIFGVKFSVSNGIYIFEDLGNGFEQTQKLTQNYHLFGQSMDYENDQIIVGSFGEQNISTAGRVDVYEKTADVWQNVQSINDSRNINLGTAISINNNLMAIGGVHAGGKGGVAIFNKDASGLWSETQYIESSNAHINDQFGFEAELFGNELIIGAPKGKDANATQGAIYIYSLDSNGQFIENQMLAAQVPQVNNNFGANITYNEQDLLVNSLSGGFGGDDTTFHHFSREGSSGSQTYKVNAKNSGSWVAQGAENQTINIEILKDGRAVIFASLNHNSDNLWLFAVGEINNHIIDFSHVYSTNGAQFGSAFASSDVNVIDEGEAQLVFNQCNQATFSYSLSAIESNEIEINKALEIPGNECGSTNKSLQIGMSGAWFDPSRSGEGFTVYISETNGTQMADVTWYTYDSNGNQLWLSGQGEVSDQSVTITEMNQFTGANLFNGTAQSTAYGSLSMSWNDCNQAVIDYDFSTINLDSGQFDVNQLTNLDNTQCNLAKK